MDFDRSSSTGISAVAGMVCPADEALATEVASAAWQSKLIFLGLWTSDCPWIILKKQSTDPKRRNALLLWTCGSSSSVLSLREEGKAAIGDAV